MMETQQTIQNNRPIKFLVAGRTASGKSTIVKAVCERLGLKQVKSLTTRPPRKEELNNSNCDHYFVTNAEFDEKEKDGLAAYTEINGYKYATTFDELDRSDIYVIDPIGIKTLKDNCGDKYRFIEIYVRTPYLINRKRYIERGGTGTEFEKRYNKESEQFKEYENNQMFDYHILNDGTIEDSIDKMSKIILNKTDDLIKEGIE